MGAMVIMAANDGINHETGYRHEHEKKKAWERHYIPLTPAYAIRQSQLDRSLFLARGRSAVSPLFHQSAISGSMGSAMPIIAGFEAIFVAFEMDLQKLSRRIDREDNLVLIAYLRPGRSCKPHIDST